MREGRTPWGAGVGAEVGGCVSIGSEGGGGWGFVRVLFTRRIFMGAWGFVVLVGADFGGGRGESWGRRGFVGAILGWWVVCRLWFGGGDEMGCRREWVFSGLRGVGGCGLSVVITDSDLESFERLIIELIRVEARVEIEIVYCEE